MKQSRFKSHYAQTSSRLHKKVGETLKNDPTFFGLRKVYQEFPVSKINPSYQNNAHKFDWVVLDLKLVIECHGQQHYSEGLYTQSLAEQKYRDKQKMVAAEEAGFTYIVVPYWDYDKINPRYLYDLYQKCYNSLTQETKTVKIESDYQRDLKEKAREYRKMQYQRLKKLKDVKR